MRERGLATLQVMLVRGEVYLDRRTGEFHVNPPADPEARRAFREDSSTIAATLRRAAAFYEQLLAPGGEADVFLKLPHIYGDLNRCPTCGGPARRCRSCGVPVQGDPPPLRCAHCEVAVEILLATRVGPERAARAAASPGPGGEGGR
jgi:hypothetical protein